MAYPRQEAQKTFVFKVHVELSNWSSDKREGGGVILCVGAWNVDGKDMKPALEKRDYWTDESGVIKYGKSRGLNAHDFEQVLENLDTIASALGMPSKMIDQAMARRKSAPPGPTAPEPDDPEGNIPF